MKRKWYIWVATRKKSALSLKESTYVALSKTRNIVWWQRQLMEELEERQALIGYSKNNLGVISWTNQETTQYFPREKHNNLHYSFTAEIIEWDKNDNSKAVQKTCSVSGQKLNDAGIFQAKNASYWNVWTNWSAQSLSTCPLSVHKCYMCGALDRVMCYWKTGKRCWWYYFISNICLNKVRIEVVFLLSVRRRPFLLKTASLTKKKDVTP